MRPSVLLRIILGPSLSTEGVLHQLEACAARRRGVLIGQRCRRISQRGSGTRECNVQFGDNGNHSQGADCLRLFTQGLVLLFISVVYGGVVLCVCVGGLGGRGGFYSGNRYWDIAELSRVPGVVNGPRHPTALIRLNSRWNIRQSGAHSTAKRPVNKNKNHSHKVSKTCPPSLLLRFTFTSCLTRSARLNLSV